LPKRSAVLSPPVWFHDQARFRQAAVLGDSPQHARIPEHDGRRTLGHLGILQQPQAKLRSNPGRIAHGDGDSRKLGGC
jgi:hypothetical protein